MADDGRADQTTNKIDQTMEIEVDVDLNLDSARAEEKATTRTDTVTITVGRMTWGRQQYRIRTASVQRKILLVP